MASTPIDAMARLGDWENLRIVQRYTNLAPEHLVGYADNARPWSRA